MPRDMMEDLIEVMDQVDNVEGEVNDIDIDKYSAESAVREAQEMLWRLKKRLEAEGEERTPCLDGGKVWEMGGKKYKIIEVKDA